MDCFAAFKSYDKNSIEAIHHPSINNHINQNK